MANIRVTAIYCMLKYAFLQGFQGKIYLLILVGD